MAKLIATILLVFVLAAGAHAGLRFKDCGSKSGKVISVNVDPAPKGQCTFPKGTNVTASIEVEIDEVTSKLNVVCKGKVGFAWVPFPLPNPDACAQGITCPTTAGSTYTFKTVIPILHSYPDIKVVVSMEFIDDKGEDAICMEFPGQICSA